MSGLSARERKQAERARNQREEAIRLLRAISDTTIEDYIRRGRLTALPDGHKPRTLTDGQPVGQSPLTLVEAMADRLAFAGTEGVARIPEDRTGRAIRAFFDALASVEAAADRVHRQMTDIARLASTREYKTGGNCACCHRDVPGTETDRLRAGYCNSDWMAYCRAGRPDNRAGFEQERRAELEDGNSETAGQTA